MGRLVDDLLDVARITRGNIAPQSEPLDLRVVWPRSKPRAVDRSRRHDSHAAIPSTRSSLRGDFARLAQVFANLLNNAAKYTDEGGSIELEMWLRQGQAVVERARQRRRHRREMLSRIFELFVQGRRSLERGGRLGLGLALVASPVELHGGTVDGAERGIGPRHREFWSG